MALIVWVVHLLLLVLRLMERLLTFPLTISKVGISNTVVLNQALLSVCLTCWSCADLLLVHPSAFRLPLMYLQAPRSCHFGPPTAAFPQDPVLIGGLHADQFHVVCSIWSTFHPTSRRTFGL